MSIYYHTLFRTLAMIFAITAAPGGFAATKIQDFYNDTTLNYAFLFADSPAISFTDIKFKTGFEGWTLESLTPSTAVFFGPQVAARAGRFQLKFDYSAPVVTFQWAEALFDASANTYTINTSGTAQYNSARGGSWASNNTFSTANAAYIESYFAPIVPPSSSVPVPASAVLFLSASALLGITRRRMQAPRALPTHA